jgi:hypothetical protein
MWPCIVDIMQDKDQLDATKYADLLTQHVSGTNMPIVRSTIVSSTLVSKPGKPPGLCSAGLLDVYCLEEVAQPIWHKHPLFKIANHTLVDLPTPSTVRGWWNFGSLLGICLVAQIVTGLFLTIHYCPTSHFLWAIHTSNSPAVHNPGSFPGLESKVELTIVLLTMGILVPETCWVNKSAYFVASSWSLSYIMFFFAITMALLSPDVIRLLQNILGFIKYISLNHCLSVENKDICVYMYIYVYGIIKEIVTLFT